MIFGTRRNRLVKYMPLSRTVFLVVPLVASLCLSSAPKTVVADDLDDLTAPASASAEEAFARYCAPCHGKAGRGGSVAGLSKPAPDLTRLTARNGGTFPRERLAQIVDGRKALAAHGSREMPVWGDWFKLEGEEAYEGSAEEEGIIRKRIEDLLDLLQSMQES